MNHEAIETRLAEILVTESFGSLIVHGPDRTDLLPALAGVASEVLVVADEDAEEVVAALAEMGTAAGVLAPGGLPEGEVACGLVLGRLPEDGVEETIERLLAGVADHGFVLCDLPAMARSLRLRIERLLRSTLAEIRPIPGAEDGALLLCGRRKARGVDQVALLDRPPLPLTIYVYSARADEGLNELVLDLLFRQSAPPALLIVLDDAAREEDRVPDDLWGLAGHSVTQPVIMRSEGRGRVAALRLGLEQLETEQAAFLESGQRPSALWAERLSDFLEEEPDCTAVVGGAVGRFADGSLSERALGGEEGPIEALAILLTGAPPCSAAMVFRDGPWLGDLPEGSDEDAFLLMLLRAAQAGPIGNVPLPLAVFSEREEETPGRELALRLLAAELDMTRLEAGLFMVPPEDRPGLARHVLAGALHEVAAFDLALPLYREALELEPDLLDLRVDHLRALRASGDREAFLAAAEEALARAPEEPRYRLALAAARTDLGRLEGLEELLQGNDDGDDETAALMPFAAASVAALRLGDAALGEHLEALLPHLGHEDLPEELLDLLPGSAPGEVGG